MITDHETIVHGLKMYYRTVGDQRKRTLVFLPGWAARKSGPFGLGVDKVIVELAKHFYVIAPEMPGLIRSEPPKEIWNIKEYADHMHVFLKSIKVDNYTLMGQSFGGGVATELAAHYPNGILKLVLVDALPSNRGNNIYERGLFKWDMFSKNIINSRLVPMFLKKVIITINLGVPWTFIREDRMYAYSMMLTIQQRYRVEVDYTRLKMPLLLVWGNKDKYVTPLKRAQEINKEVVDSKLVIVKGGHTILFQKPQYVINEILKHL